MAYTIKVDGVNLPSHVVVASGSIDLTEGQPGEKKVLNFDLIDKNTNDGDPFSWSMLIGKKIELYEGSTLKFGGQLDCPETEKINNYPILRQRIACTDWQDITDRTYINQSYPRQLISDIFKDMIDDFLAADGIWYDGTSIQETTGQYLSINCPYTKANDTFDEMAGLINWIWYLGPDKKFYFHEIGHVTGPTIVENQSNYLPGSLKVARDRSDYRNKQVLTKVNALTDLLTEQAAPVPDQNKSYTVRFPVNQVPQLYVVNPGTTTPDSSELVDPHSVGIGGLDTGLIWYWNKGSNIIQLDNEQEIETDKILMVRYVGQYEIDIVEQDNTAIAERQAIEGGSGVYTFVESGDGIEGVEVAENKAQALLERYARIAKKIEFDSYTIDLNPGQIIDVIAPSFNIDTTGDSDKLYLVVEKRTKDVGPLLLKSYSLIDGAPLISWIKYFSNLVSMSKDWEIRPDAIVDIPISEDESFEWSGSVEIKTFDCLYPADDPGGLYPSNLLYPGTLTSTVVEND